MSLFRRRRRASDDGFTLIEMMVALTIIGGVLVAMAFLLTGSLGALGASKQRSGFTQIANGEIESLRSLSFEDVGVSATDPDLGTQYPGGKFDGRDPVSANGATTPRARSEVAVAPTAGLPVPYSVERWVTWTDTSGGSSHQLKLVTVRVTWNENSGTDRRRSVRLSSVLYPGGLGVPASTNKPPVANFTVSDPNPAEGSVVTFTSAVTDPDGDAPLKVVWDFGDGSAKVTGAHPSSVPHTYVLPGFYTAQVSVDDNKGGTDSFVTDIAVRRAAGNVAPAASFTPTPTPSGPHVVGTAPFAVSVNAGTSTDANGDQLKFTWTWGDGTPNGSGVNTSHTYSDPGDYTITLQARDSSGGTSSATQAVKVNPLNCKITSGSFKNPESNNKSNDVFLTNTNTPKDLSFTFFAETNLACGSVAGQLPYVGGTFEVGLISTGSSGGTRLWKGTGQFPTGSTMSSGTSQTGFFVAPAAAPTTSLQFTFSAK